MPLEVNANITDADGFYSDLIDLHNGLSDEESHALNARLVLILCNHIGDPDSLKTAFELAVKSGST